MALLGPNGQPISTAMFENKKKAAPPLGEKFGRWGGPEVQIMKLPGGGAIQFDLDALTLGDFRQMLDHYQVNSSLTVLMFLMHQMEWRITCDNKKQEAFYNEAFGNIWTQLVRSKSKAFWAGYSPNVLQWENETSTRRVVISKIKDLHPEDCSVHWKTVGEGVSKFSTYDGINQFGAPKPIPVDNSYWYPLLMEGGNYGGKKLLRSAFQPWFFSILMHLFANRYYERFGEPTPIGRAPYDDEVRYGGQTMAGNDAMEMILGQLRNRSAVVLPSDRTPMGDETNPQFDYQIEYLESQMRGADFERYMTRLDEEISLALFTPILLMRTADVGSYNLGTQHSIIYQWMLNAIAGDWKHYIDWYILRPLRNWNFGERASLPKIHFRKMGAQNEDMVRDIVRAMISKGSIKPDLAELGEIAGLTLTEVKELTEEPKADDEGTPGDPTQPSQADDPSAPADPDGKGNRAGVGSVIAGISERVGAQAASAFRKNKLPEARFDLGFQSRMTSAFSDAGCEYPEAAMDKFYEALSSELVFLVQEGWNSPEAFTERFTQFANETADQIIRSKR